MTAIPRSRFGDEERILRVPWSQRAHVASLFAVAALVGWSGLRMIRAMYLAVDAGGVLLPRLASPIAGPRHIPLESVTGVAEYCIRRWSPASFGVEPKVRVHIGGRRSVSVRVYGPPSVYPPPFGSLGPWLDDLAALFGSCGISVQIDG